MLNITRRSIVLGSLALLLFLSGCRKGAGQQPAQPAPPAAPPAPPVIAPVSGPGGAVFATIPAANRDALANDLKQIGTAYLNAAITGQPPHNAKDLGMNQGKMGQAINDGTYVILWGADPARPGPGGAANTILGYVKDAPEKGGVVLMLDGTVNLKMTAEEFKAAPKAGK